MEKLYKDVYFMVEEYDKILDESNKKWEEVHKLKPKRMDEAEFSNLIIDTRFTRKLIKEFLADNPYKCKNLIYSGANKEFLYEYVSNIDNNKLTLQQKCILEDLHNIRKSKHFPYVYDSEICDIRIITIDMYDKLINKFDKKEEFTYEEKDRFILEEDGSYIAIDNTSGEMWVEKFKDKDLAERYLRGEDIDELDEEENKDEI